MFVEWLAQDFQLKRNIIWIYRNSLILLPHYIFILTFQNWVIVFQYYFVFVYLCVCFWEHFETRGKLRKIDCINQVNSGKWTWVMRLKDKCQCVEISAFRSFQFHWWFLNALPASVLPCFICWFRVIHSKHLRTFLTQWKSIHCFNLLMLWHF